MPENITYPTITTTEGRHDMPATTITATPTSLELAATTAGLNGVISYTYESRPPLDYLVTEIDNGNEQCVLVQLDSDSRHRHVMRLEHAAEPRWHVLSTGTTVRRAADALRRSEPVTMPAGSMVPATAAEARRMADALTILTSWSDGGERHMAAQDIAANHPEGELCGSYEALVCPTFGWAPRRSQDRWAPNRQLFTDRMAAWERDNAHLSAVDRLEARARLYERGGVMNQAACDHIRGHLESHKVPAVNDLLGKIGWDTVDLERDWTVTVRVERTRTVTEYAYVTFTRTAVDEEQASDSVDAYDVNCAADDVYDWAASDEDIDITDWDIERVDLD